MMEDKVIEKTTESIKKIVDEGLNTNNIEHLYKLSKIKHLAKEDKEMYGNYSGRGPSRGSYGEYDNYGNYGEYGRGSYGRRGYDMKYRGDDEFDRMAEEYGRYQERRNRYGAGEEVDKAHHYMVKSLGDFIKFLYEDSETPQQKQMITEELQKNMR